MDTTREDVLDFFHYWPSKAASIAVLVLFAAVAVAVLVQTVRSRAWFMLTATIVALLEVAGFGLRIGMLSSPLRGNYIAMQCLLIIPPSFLALVDYIALGKLVGLIQATKPPGTPFRLKPKALTWVFFALEIGSLACQGAGAGLSVGTDDDAPPTNGGAGKALLIAGLAALVALISFFLGTTIYVHRNPKFHVPEVSATMNIIFVGLYGTTSLLLIRNIFRLVEFSQGWYGWIARHEIFFYLLDSLMIFLWLLLMVPLHLGLYLKRLQAEVTHLTAKGAVGSDKGADGYHHQHATEMV